MIKSGKAVVRILKSKDFNSLDDSQKVSFACAVLLTEILDARDPQECRDEIVKQIDCGLITAKKLIEASGGDYKAVIECMENRYRRENPVD